MAELLQLPPALDRRLRGELEEGETLLWTGQPRPAAWVHKGIGVMPFGALFLGFLVWMNGSGSGETEGGAALNLPLMFVIPFGIIAFIFIHQEQQAYEEAFRLIEAGEAERVELEVTRLWTNVRNERTRHYVHLSDGDAFNRRRLVSQDVWDGSSYRETTDE